MDKETRKTDYRASAEYQAALSFLFERINFERVAKMPYSNRDLNISRMRRLLELLEDPHDKLKIIHVAGTKGKGSTTAFLSSALVAAGLKCGSYTSPHLEFVEERFRIDGEPCSAESLVELIEFARSAIEQMDSNYEGGGPTYFEICTAISFLLFVQQEVDVAILEVGLGGRLDSTNVCTPLVSVITNISFDHVKQLGNTLRKIATEKAGIIKPGVPVISGATAPEARQAIEEIAAKNESSVWQREIDFTVANYQVAGADRSFCQADFQVLGSDRSDKFQASSIESVDLGLLGEHQAMNACVAWATLQVLPAEIRPNEEAIQAGFAATRCAARIEVVADSPNVIVDASHNVASAQALADVLTSCYPDRRRILILGATTGKDVRGMLEILLPVFDEVICTQYQDNPRAYEANSLFDLSKEIAGDLSLTNRIHCEPTPDSAWRAASELAEVTDQICVAGSFFIAAEIKQIRSAIQARRASE